MFIPNYLLINSLKYVIYGKSFTLKKNGYNFNIQGSYDLLMAALKHVGMLCGRIQSTTF